MEVLGTIDAVCACREFTANGSRIVVYPIIFKGEGQEFLVDCFHDQEYLTKRGIRAGMVGRMDMEFKVRERKTSSGDSFPMQSIKMIGWRAANMGAFDSNVPAASGAQ